MTVTETPPPAITDAAARTVHARKIYGAGDTLVNALDDVTVEFERRKFTAIMGPSGSGKSTLMHCVAGLDTLTSGQIFIGDVDLSSLNERQLTRLRRDTIGFVFQSFNLIPTLTAAENITLPMDLAGTKPDAAGIDTIVSTRALASRPAIVFADEPTGNLDSRSGGEILQFMRTAVDQFEQSIVMVTHDPVAASYADRVVFLADGRIVDEIADPTAEAVLERQLRFGA